MGPRTLDTAMGRVPTIIAMAAAERMTADEYLVMGEERHGMELIAGEVHVEQASLTHQRTVSAILRALWKWIDAGEDRGEAILAIDVKLDDRNVFGPDLLWYSAGHGPAEDRPRPHPVPDLAIEVRSPSTWRYDLGHKKALYEAHALPELWLVDIEGDTVLVFRRSRPDVQTFDTALELSRGERLTSPLLPGFTLALDRLFGGH